MSIWFALWFVLSFVLLAFFAWSVYVILQQKRTWKAFAEKHSLRFVANKMMQGPEMEGLIDGFKYSFFTSEHMTNDMRSTRKLSAVEVTLKSKMPMDGGVASGSMVTVLSEIAFRDEVKPVYEGWNKTYMASSDNAMMLEAYLTPERLDVLTRLMKIKNVWVIFAFKNDMTLLRIDTSNPMTSLEQMEKLVKVLGKAANVLELSKGEEKTLSAAKAREIEHKNTIQIEEAAGGLSLELEEDSQPLSQALDANEIEAEADETEPDKD